MDYIYPNLCQELNKASVSEASLARFLGISDESIRNKLSGIESWRLSEAVNICRLLNNSNIRFLFLQLNYNSKYLENQECFGGICRNV